MDKEIVKLGWVIMILLGSSILLAVVAIIAKVFFGYDFNSNCVTN